MSKKRDYFDTMTKPVQTGDRLQFSTEGLVQERLFQRRQRRLLLLVEPRQPLGFGGEASPERGMALT